MLDRNHHCSEVFEYKLTLLEQLAEEDDCIIEDDLTEEERMELGFELLHREDETYDWNY